MKKRILSLCFALVLMFSVFTVPASAAHTGEELYQKLFELIEIYKQFSLFSSEDADSNELLKQALIRLFEQDETNFNVIANVLYGLNDRYSTYIPAGVYESAYSFAPARYYGIGVAMLQGDEGAIVSDVIENTPAERAGILPGDVITHVDGKSVKGLPTNELAELVRGEEGSFVTVSILREGKSLVFSMIREAIGQKAVSWEIPEEGVGYLNLPTFLNTEDYLPEVMSALEELVRNRVKSVVVDLRGNGGGELGFMYQVANALIPEADVTFLGLRERTGIVEIQSNGSGVKFNKIVFLVNGNTASASEVLAGSLRDVCGAVLVGEKTYGKGMCQGHLIFADDSAAVVTTAEMILPSTGSYDEKGLAPDFEVKNGEAPLTLPQMKTLYTDKALFMTNYSDYTYALNERLAFLGYLKKPEYAYKSFDTETQNAVNAFQRDAGLSVTGHCDKKTLKAIEERITEIAKTRVVVDNQYEKALEIAREGLKEPLGYEYDAETDTFVNR